MSKPDQEMRAYYAERAPVYDRVYSYPERQADLRTLEARIASAFEGRRVLEVAAGTGYWTQFISRCAAAVTATDANPEPLEQIASRDLHCPVATVVTDAYVMDNVTGTYDAAFAGLWFSHVPIERRAEWLAALHGRLEPGAKVIFIDNSTAQCERLPITRTDEQGNTYQTRTTDDGNTFEVLKNFPEEQEMLALLRGAASAPHFEALEHLWSLTYTYQAA